MLDFYIWKPRLKEDNPEEGSFKNIAKSITKDGRVGHMSLAVTVYENSHDLSAIDNQFPNLEFQQAFPIYESIKTGEKDGIAEYQRGKKLKGLSAFLSLWPKGRISKVDAIQSFFRKGGKVEPFFNSMLQGDMSEISSDPKRMIEHHQGDTPSKFEPAELTKNLKELETKLKEAEDKHSKLTEELNLYLNPPKTALQEGLDAIRQLTGLYQENTAKRPVYSNPNEKVKTLVEQNKKIELELKELKLTFHNTLLNADIPKIYTYIEGYRQLTSEFNKINDFYEDAKDINLARRQLTHYLESYSDNKDAQELLSIQSLIEKNTKTLNRNKNELVSLRKEIEKEKDKLRDLNNHLLTVNKEITNFQDKIKELKAEIQNIVVTKGLAPDYNIVLPTSESGQPYFLDEIAILKKMEAIKTPNYKYDMFDKNCARCVKECLLAGTSDLQESILNLPSVPSDFFDSRFLETPTSVMKWIFKLNDYINTLNQDHKLKPKGNKLSI